MTSTVKRGERGGPGAPCVLALLGLLSGVPGLAGCQGGPAIAAETTVSEEDAGGELLDPEPSGGPGSEEAGTPVAPPELDDVSSRAPEPGGHEPAGPGSSPSPAPPATAEIDAALREVGRPAVVGLPASRTVERQSETAEIQARLAAELEGGHASAWRSRMRAILSSTPASGGDPAADELWAATVRVVGRLRRYEFAELLSDPLEREGLDPEKLVVQEALHDLYGKWFDSEAELEPFLSDVRPGPGTALLLENVARSEEAARARLFETVRHSPAEAGRWFSSPDGRLRAGVARAVGEALISPDSKREELLGMLLDQLEREPDARAFHGVLTALSIPAASLPPDAEAIVRMRGVLFRIAESGNDPRVLAATQALARLPWSTTGDRGETHLIDGVEVVGRALEGLSAAGRGADPDLTLGVLESLEALCGRAVVNDLGDALRTTRARRPVIAILKDEERGELLRAAAVSTLRACAKADDLLLLLSVLRTAEDSPSLSHSLLGALGAILPEVDPTSTDAHDALLVVAERSGSDDPDLRRRALTLLANPELDLAVRRLEPGFLVERLADEEVPGLSRAVVRLIRRFGRPDMLDSVLSVERFEALASGDRAQVAELAEMLEALAADRAEEGMRAAARLVESHRGTAGLDTIRSALRLVSHLDPEGLADLPHADHRLVCSWAWRLHRDGIPLLEAVPEGVIFLERLVQLHWPRSGLGAVDVRAQAEFGEAERRHLLAVTLGLLVTQGVAGYDESAAESEFARTLKLAESGSTQVHADQVRRDRARFRARLGRNLDALNDYRILAEDDALEIPDLRRAIELLASVASATPAGRRALAPETFDLLGRIVGNEAWHTEPDLVRMQDLRELGRTARISEDPGRQRRLHEALADLPAEPVVDAAAGESTPGAGTATPEPRDLPLWNGLVRDPQRHAELLELQLALENELAETGAARGG